ncbi:MAG: hypothetical protein WBF17_11415 [Phycisphaerae bacterium]
MVGPKITLRFLLLAILAADSWAIHRACAENARLDGSTVAGARKPVARVVELPMHGGGKVRLSVKETPLLNGYLPGKVGFTEISPDNRHVVYIVKRADTRLVLVVDGVERKAVEGTLESKPMFGPDSKCLAFLVKRGDQRVAVVDGEYRKEYKGVKKGTRIPSLSGKPAFRVDGNDGRRYLMRDAKPGKSRYVSPDGKRVAREAKRGGKSCIIVDGVEGKPYDWVYQPICGSYFCFSPDSKRVAYTAQRDKKWFAVVDGVESAEYSLARDIVFSPDSKHFAYQASRKGEGDFLVVDGAEVRLPGSFLRCRRMITFDSPTSLHAVVGHPAGVSLVEIEIAPKQARERPTGGSTASTRRER